MTPIFDKLDTKPEGPPPAKPHNLVSSQLPSSPNERCFVCGDSGVRKIRAQIGYRPGPYHYSPYIHLCDSDFCLIEFSDFAHAVAGDLRRLVKNRRLRESRAASKKGG